MEVEFLHSEEAWLEELEKCRLPIFQTGRARDCPQNIKWLPWRKRELTGSGQESRR